VKQRWLLTTEETPSGEETVTAEASELQEKCTRQPVLTAKLKQKCLSSPTPKDRFTAGIVFLTTGHPEKTADIKPEFIELHCKCNNTMSVSLPELRFGSPLPFSLRAQEG
jgi:hypothetical protein